jgi:hypothetical protein
MAPQKKAAKKKAAVKQGAAVKKAPVNTPFHCPPMKQCLADALYHADALLSSPGMTPDVIKNTKQFKGLLTKAQQYLDVTRSFGLCVDDVPKRK